MHCHLTLQSLALSLALQAAAQDCPVWSFVTSTSSEAWLQRYDEDGQVHDLFYEDKEWPAKDVLGALQAYADAFKATATKEVNHAFARAPWLSGIAQVRVNHDVYHCCYYYVTRGGKLPPLGWLCCQAEGCCQYAAVAMAC